MNYIYYWIYSLFPENYYVKKNVISFVLGRNLETFMILIKGMCTEMPPSLQNAIKKLIYKNTGSLFTWYSWSQSCRAVHGVPQKKKKTPKEQVSLSRFLSLGPLRGHFIKPDTQVLMTKMCLLPETTWDIRGLHGSWISARLYPPIYHLISSSSITGRHSAQRLAFSVRIAQI